MAEGPERAEDDFRRPPEEDIEEFRRMLQADYGPDGVDEKGPEDGRGAKAEGAEEEAARADGPEKEIEVKDQPPKGGASEAVDSDKAAAPGSAGEGSTDRDAAQEDKEAAREQVDGAGAGPAKPPVEDGAEERATSGEGEEPKEQRDLEAPHVENYSQNDNQVAVIEQSPGQDRDGQAETEGLQRLQTETRQESEPRVFEAVDYGRGANLRVPSGDLEQAGYDPPDHNSIVQLGLRHEGSEDIETVFARYSASDHRAEAYVGDIGGEKGSKYELVEARGVDEDRLVREFERGKCEHLDNVRLEHDRGKMFLNVDGREVELEGHRITTSGSHLVVRGKLEGEDRCKLEFDGHRASVKFGRDYPVEGMRMEKDELVIKYEQSRSETHEHRVYLEHLWAPERPSLSQFDKQEMKEHTKTFDLPERVEGVYRFVVDRDSVSETNNLLHDAHARGKNEYGMMRAEISERLAPNLLELVGWERMVWHPYNETDKVGAAANGPDWLMRTPDGKLVLVEVKWWADTEGAECRAEPQLTEYLRDKKRYNGEQIVGAYVAVLDWDASESPMKINIKRVREKDGVEL